MGVALAVIFAGVLHAVWNAVAKGVPDRKAGFALIGAGQAFAGLLVLPFVAVPATAAWPWLGISIVVHLGYVMLLARSYDLGDFGQVYPLARGSAPLLVAVVATVALHERLGVAQLCGVVAVCAGLCTLAFARGSATNRRAVTMALLTGMSIGTNTLVDGIGVRLAHGPAGYSSWMFVLEGPLTVAWVLMLRGRSVLAPVRASWKIGLAGGVISAIGYGIVIWAQTRGALAAVAALRETGVISGAIIGAVFFAEPLGRRRIAAAGIVVLGVVLINTR